MQIGIALPQNGSHAGPEFLSEASRRAESLGFHSLWVSERLLWPVAPRTPYPPAADGQLPELVKSQLDPLETLGFAAARTTRIRLGTSIVNLPFHNPLILARRFATLDVLSGGRICVGLGNGWSADEFEAAGVAQDGRGPLIDEALAVLKAVWTSDPVEFSGEHFKIPRSFVQPKPVQKPHPPILMAAFTEPALRRVALQADGWNPAGLPFEVMAAMFQSIKQMAAGAGRDPSALQLVIRANVVIYDQAQPAERPPFHGDPAQIGADVTAAREIGADGLFFDAQAAGRDWSPEEFLGSMEQLYELAERG